MRAITSTRKQIGDMLYYTVHVGGLSVNFWSGVFLSEEKIFITACNHLEDMLETIRIENSARMAYQKQAIY